MHYNKLSKLFYKEGDNYTEKEYEKRISSYGSYLTPFSVNGFKKGKLTKDPHSLFYMNTSRLMELNNKILQNSSIISTLITKLPSYIVEPYFHKMIVNEAQSNNEIEGVRSTKKELKEVLDAINRSAIKHKRFTGLMKTYLYLDKTKPFKDVADFRKLYDDLVSEEIANENAPEGKLFRKEYVEVNNGISVTHIGVSSEDKIIESLNTLIAYLEDEEQPELYRYMAAHYFYEYVHPFYDGNGRTGRLIVCSYLSRYLERYSAITFSYAVNKNKAKYYKALEEVSHPLNRGEMTFYLVDMLEILSMGQIDIIEDLEINLAKLERIKKYFKKEEWVTRWEEEKILMFMVALSVFLNSEISFPTTQLMDSSNMTRYMVDKVMNKFETNGYVEKVSQRPKAYKVTENFLESMLGIW